MTVVNSHIVHQHMQCETGINMNHLEFRRPLVGSLFEPLQTSQYTQCIPRSVPRLNKTPHFLKKRSRQRGSVVCSGRAQEGS